MVGCAQQGEGAETKQPGDSVQTHKIIPKNKNENGIGENSGRKGVPKC